MPQRSQILATRARRLTFGLAVLGLALAPWQAAAQSSLQPTGWDTTARLAEAPDLNPDPHIVEVNLDARVADVEIAPGQHVQAWTYNGVVPGPLIHVTVGDRLIVHFVNHLPVPTTVHWHGLRIPVQMDGVPGNSQPEVKPGESFTYDFVVPDAGLFWYHPHVMSAAQVGFGLTGALLVDDPADRVGVADQQVLVLSDMELRENGEFESPDTGGSGGMAFGREGNVVLTNGRRDLHITARRGVPIRWRIVNTAKSRYFNLQLEGQHFWVIGGAGGLNEYGVDTDGLVIPPGERRDVIVAPTGAPDSPLLLRSLLYDRGYGSIEARYPFENLLAISFDPEPPYQTPKPPAVTRAIEPLNPVGATPVTLELTIAQLTDGSFEYRVNGKPFAGDQPIPASLGETQVWTIVNKTKWSHPFHLHGFFFQILDEKGQPERPLAWKDTVDVPYEQTRKIVVRFDDRPGMWMVHCHILDHAEGGLMLMVQLGPAEHHHEMDPH